MLERILIWAECYSDPGRKETDWTRWMHGSEQGRQELGTVLQPLRQPNPAQIHDVPQTRKVSKIAPDNTLNAKPSSASLPSAITQNKSFSQDRKDECMCSESSSSMIIGAKVQKWSQHNTQAWVNCLKCNWCQSLLVTVSLYAHSLRKLLNESKNWIFCSIWKNLQIN